MLANMGKEFGYKTHQNDAVKIGNISSNILEVLVTVWWFSIYWILVLSLSSTELKRQKITCFTSGGISGQGWNRDDTTDHDLRSFYEQLQQHRAEAAIKPNSTNTENIVEVWVVMVLIITFSLCVLLDMFWCSHTLCIAVTNHKK